MSPRKKTAPRDAAPHLDEGQLTQLLGLIEERDPVLHARIHDVTPYALRHTFAVMALRNGADIYQLKRLMGHANITTTEIYLKHAAPPRKALARMARHLGLDS